MKRAFKWLGLFLAGLLLVGVALFINVWYLKPLRIDWFYGTVFAKFAIDRPEFLSSLRILPRWLDFYSDDLDDVSPAAEQRAADQLRDAYAMLRRYDRSALDREGKLSYDTLEYFLRIQVDGDAWRLHGFPVNQTSGIQSGLPNFMTQVHRVTSTGEAHDYIARLAKFPRKFEQLIESLKLRESRGIIPPRFAVEKVLQQMGDFVALEPRQNPLYKSFEEKLDKITSDRVDASTRQRLLAQVEDAIRSGVQPAYRELIAYMQSLLPKAQGNHGAWQLPDGNAYYAWCVRHHTTTDMSPKQLHDLGLAEVARIAADMSAILESRGLREGTLGMRVRQLATDPAQLFPNTAEGKAAMLARYKVLLEEAEQGVGAAFDVRPKLGVEVRPVPEFAQATAPGAYYTPGSFDGSRPGVFYANLRNTADTPKFVMATLAYHEGIPGHHFQIAIAQELSHLPFFRRVLPFTAYSEGWALYAERLAWELGLEKDPLDNLGRLRDEMLRAVRLVVDTGIHAERWTRGQAIGYMADNTGMAQADVAAEVERYFVQPGQALAYKAGMLEILALRERARTALGSRFDLKQFHNEILTHGALPLTVLRQVVDDWIERRKNA
ncbi:MAG TPA: DUF885 domain-containing protein [Burkholderiaceae bacterium]|nr:DUF885 domain-containing protein [Burkholderiaceae bacterium]